MKEKKMEMKGCSVLDYESMLDKSEKDKMFKLPILIFTLLLQIT